MYCGSLFWLNYIRCILRINARAFVYTYVFLLFALGDWFEIEVLPIVFP